MTETIEHSSARRRATERGASSLEMGLMLVLVALVAVGGIRALGLTAGGEDIDTASDALGDEAVRIDADTEQGLSSNAGAGGSSGAFGSAASGVTGTGQQAGNSGFDHGDDSGYWNTRSTGQQIGDWTVTSGTVDARTTHDSRFNQDEIADGNFMDLNGGGPGSVERTLDVIPGADYNLSIDLGENSYGGPAVKTMAIEWNGEVVSTLEVDLPPNTLRTFTVKLPPSADPNARLSFRSLNTSAHGVLIDNPTLTLIPVRAD